MSAQSKEIKIVIIAGAILFISIILRIYDVIWTVNAPVFSNSEKLAVSVRTGNATKEIQIWEMENGEAYFFLPAYADLTNCFFVYDEESCELELDEKRVASGESLKEFATEIPYKICFFNKNTASDYCRTVTFMKSENLPALYLETESGSLEYVHEDKENREAAFMEIVDASGRVLFNEGIESLKGHGNTSWTWDKKPYQIKLEKEKSLLGMGSGRKWILLANMHDGAYIRNRVALELAEMTGMSYTPQSQYVDLYINNEYLGNYQLAEKIEIGTERIDIHNLEKANAGVNPDDYKQNERFGEEDGAAKGVENIENPEDITGGYLLERNYGGKYENKVSGFVTETGESFVVRAPSYASREEIAYIADVVQCIETAILASDGVDDKTGLYYTDLIDQDSFVKKYLLEEIVLNEANMSTSAWFYKPENTRSTKLFAGPAWDYDKAFANQEPYLNPRVLSKMVCYYNNSESTKWFYNLYEKEDFVEEVKKQYETIFLPELQVIRSKKIDEYAELIRASVRMDQIRWKNEKNFDTEVAFLGQWLDERTEFLNEVWIEDQEVCLVRYLQKTRRKLESMESVPVNGKVQLMPDMKAADENFLYWYDEEKGAVFDPEQKITGDITLLPIYAEE